jgi:hypothetical protein
MRDWDRSRPLAARVPFAPSAGDGAESPSVLAGLMLYSFARISAGVAMKVEDVLTKNRICPEALPPRGAASLRSNRAQDNCRVPNSSLRYL